MEEFVPSRPNLKKLNIGDRILVTFSDITKLYYAIYSDFDEFDVHMPELEPDETRAAWYKHSCLSVRQFCKI